VPPKRVFVASCPTCGEARKFIEFKAEPCGPESPFERRYGFRCLACKTIVESLTDAGGERHAWVEGRHVTA
jgi:hypothetical protein